MAGEPTNGRVIEHPGLLDFLNSLGQLGSRVLDAVGETVSGTSTEAPGHADEDTAEAMVPGEDTRPLWRRVMYREEDA